jgi:uncharacterized protein involved in response to NO
VSPILSYGFRPFFLAASIYAAIAIPLWLAFLFLGGVPTGAFSGATWHAHEMIFGFLGAVIAGFILTAIPNWTGMLPLSGGPLLVLVAAWLLGRLCAYAPVGPLVSAICDLIFPALLAGSVWREILAGRNYRNTPIAVLLTLFAAANFLDHWGASVPEFEGYGRRLALGVAAVLIALVGGRIVPSFTRNWMSRLHLTPLPAPMSRIDTAALAITGFAMLAWVIFPDWYPIGVLLVVAGVALVIRLSRWRGWQTFRSPIVVILHLGYLWLSLALVLNGLAVIWPEAALSSSGIHALTAGAIGTMTLAVMTRATLGHTGRPLEADGWTMTIYALVTVGAAARVAAPFLPSSDEMLIVAGLLWSAAFAAFALRYGPFLLSPKIER